MQQQTKGVIKKNITNFFGSLGYLFCFLQWLWVVLLYFSVILSVTSYIAPPAQKQVVQPVAPTFALPSSLTIVIVAIITIIMLGITIYALIKVPMGIVKNSNKIVHKTAETVTPFVIKTQHKKDTKKFHITMTARLIFVIKLLLIIIPIALSAASGLLKNQSISYVVAMTVAGGLAGFSVVSFAMQYLLAGLLRVKRQDIW